MGPYESANSCCRSSNSGSSSSSLGKPANDIDGLLAGAGYKVRSFDLRHVAQRLERLETAMAVDFPAINISQLASDGIHYNPSNIGSWVDSLFSELNHPTTDSSFPPPLSSHSDLPDFPDLILEPVLTG